MKTLITYSSNTGNTEFFCTEVYKNLKDKFDIHIQKMKETKNVEDYDTIIVGYWVDKGTANKEAMKFIKKIEGKKIGFLATLGASPDSEHADKVRKNAKELPTESNTYLGIELARGKVSEKLTKRIKFIPFLPSHIKEQMYEASVNSREPNQEEIDRATEFLEKVLS